jgi:hypothetical protein
MDKKSNTPQEENKPAPDETRKEVIAAHDQAEKDMDADPEISATSPNDDLDEAETARLGEDKTDLV